MKKNNRLIYYKTNPFIKLPEEIFCFCIIYFLTPNEIGKISSTNKFMCRLCNNNLSWKLICENQFSKDRVEILLDYHTLFKIENIQRNCESWKEIYKKIFKITIKISKRKRVYYQENYVISFNNKPFTQVSPKKEFIQMNLSRELLAGVYFYGFQSLL